MMRRFATLALVLASFASPLAAQSHPDFSGKWVLDTKASEGPMMPQAMTVVVTQDAKTLKVENTQTMAMGDQKMDQKSTLTYNLDGSVAKNTINPMAGTALEVASTTAWNVDTLVITTKVNLPSGEMTQVDHWSKTPDGKSVTLIRDVSLGGQSVSIKMVLVKQ
jgi:hypothetical protein